jgi:NAD(P)-dependent dehydrogenase (short-subunit alcohol dehydrogenase family)
VHALSRGGATGNARLAAGTVDIEDEASIALAASTISLEGPLDLVIVASGLLHGVDVSPEKSYRQLSAAALNRYFGVNATGPALVAKHFLPLCVETGLPSSPPCPPASAASETIVLAAGTAIAPRRRRST